MSAAAAAAAMIAPLPSPTRAKAKKRNNDDANVQQPNATKKEATNNQTSTTRKQRNAPAIANPPASAAASSSSTAATAPVPAPRYNSKLPSQHSSTSPVMINAPSPSPSPVPAQQQDRSRFLFHSPPSLFRTHTRAPPVLDPILTPGAVQPSHPPPAVHFPGSYAPVNLLRLLRALSPTFPFEQPPTNGVANAQTGASSSTMDYTLSQLWAFYDNPYGHEISLLLDPTQLLQPTPMQAHGTEVYFVPHLSALVLYEKAAESATAAPSEPLLQWFECVAPYQRLPLIDQIASIASCFSPAPSSPLYKSFAPFPSKRILQDLPASSLDLQRSWYAITWYPILHDPLTTPVLAGCFLMYHSFHLETTRRCPLQESDFDPLGSRPPVGVVGVSSSNGVARNQHARMPSPLPSADTPDAEELESDGGSTLSEAVEADGEMESETDSQTGGSIRRRKQKALFPPHLCAHCGDRHGVLGCNDASAAPSAASPAYLPLLAYLCHRVLPSTWFVHAHSTHALTQHGIVDAAPSHTPLHHPPHPNSHASSHASHQLESIAHFNALLHHAAPSSAFAHLTLAHQPTRFTHADITQPMHALLQAGQHADYMHMTNRIASTKQER